MVAGGAGVAVVLAGVALVGPLGFGGRAPAGAEPERFPGTGPEPVSWVATYDGQTVYASVGAAIMRSTDGGAGWTEVARRVSSEGSVTGVVMPDGDLEIPPPPR